MYIISKDTQIKGKGLASKVNNISYIKVEILSGEYKNKIGWITLNDWENNTANTSKK
jgi:hypothetical protein